MHSFRTPALSVAALTLTLLAACGGDKMAEGGDAMADSIAAAAAMAEPAAIESFMVTLTGAAERPTAVSTTAQAEATILVHADSIVYAVNGLEVKGVTAVHIHRGGAADAGPVLIGLLSNADGMDVASGSIVMGTITRQSTFGEGVTFDDLREAVRTGAAYVNVHTKAHPAGELRGQTNGALM